MPVGACHRPGRRRGPLAAMTKRNALTTQPKERQALPLRSYGRRKGKRLSPRKERLLELLLPRLRLDLKQPAPGNLPDLFPVPVREVWLEIGFGSGEHLLWQAEHHKEVGFIGCEPFINGMASLLGAVEDRGLKT